MHHGDQRTVGDEVEVLCLEDEGFDAGRDAPLAMTCNSHVHECASDKIVAVWGQATLCAPWRQDGRVLVAHIFQKKARVLGFWESVGRVRIEMQCGET